MKYFTKEDSLLFYKEPLSFNKYTSTSILKYAIGANLYMKGTQDNIFRKLIENTYHDLGAITLDCEDALNEKDIEKAETNILNVLEMLYKKYLDDNSFINRIPLIFIRVRNPEHFKSFAKKFNKKHLKMLAGFNFPKFNSSNGYDYFFELRNLSLKFNEILYGMPILEDDNLIYKETRFSELKNIQNILSEYNEYVLNIRVGGTDFSSRFGLRRSIGTTIYDIKVVSDCLTDILNFFLRQQHSFVVSGPVYEYYSVDKDSVEIQTLVKELQLDINNGFFGKTSIHPTQINVINQQYIVPYYDYRDAKNILESTGGAFASYKSNRMNETSPHKNWANKILARAKIFGVLEDNVSILNFSK